MNIKRERSRLLLRLALTALFLIMSGHQAAADFDLTGRWVVFYVGYDGEVDEIEISSRARRSCTATERERSTPLPPILPIIGPPCGVDCADANASNAIEVNELVMAVNNALRGCQ